MTIKTPIGYTTRDEIFVRDRNIATEILGQLDFIDMIFLAATGQTPTAYRAAHRGFVDEVIMPSQTRQKLIRAFKMLENKVATLPRKKHGNIPL